MPVSTAPQEETRVSPEAYLELERKAEEKSEYYDGEIRPMTGGSLRHAQITSNMRVYVEEHALYTYPDVTVVCGTLQTLEQEGMDSLSTST